MSRYAEYAAELKAGMEEAGVKSVELVGLLNGQVSSSDIWSWREAKRPMPPEYAEIVAARINRTPESISPRYGRLALAGLSARDSGKRSPRPMVGHLMIERLEGFGHTNGATRLVLPEFIVRPRIGLTAIANLRWALQVSVAMQPEIKPQALVFIDVSVSQRSHVVDHGIYAYTLWGSPDIRYVMIRRDAWHLACHGKGADYTMVSDADLENLRILGAVVGWLNPP
jgi:hypothetical protein